MPKSLVIVESPAKARTIAGFLGRGYVVESSIGHIRDLPKSAADIPAKHKKAAWARLGVDVDNGFQPLYVVDAGKKPHVDKLKSLLDDADELLLATDEDREGESIAWHLVEVLKPKIPVKRMVFHEITKKAIQEAIENPREIDRRLVDAQEARRILDRLYGYEVSPVLWRKVMPKLSAGRVQSVATRIIVDRERARMRFRSASYWDIEATFKAGGASTSGVSDEFAATLVAVAGERVAIGKDFDERGVLKATDADTKTPIVRLDESAATKLAEQLLGGTSSVKSIERKPYRQSPPPPFMTSTLQQEAGRKLKFAAARTMRAAQSLYEQGYITYMRTDSTTLSDSALSAARACIQSLYGAENLPPGPRVYKNKVKNAQEAHEAIRPAGDTFRRPEEVARGLGHDEAALYELIWKRTVASQMKDAEGFRVNVRVRVVARDGRECEFSASGNSISFPGFLRAYVEGSDDPNAELGERERHLPDLKENQTLSGREFKPQGHETQPPARFTEASLVRRLEELGVGRPSTYASIISTIQNRGYIWKKGTALVPSFKAFAVVALLEKYFGTLVDYTFTAKMEDELDAIAEGELNSVPWLTQFYFGAKASARDAKNTKGQSEDSRVASGLAHELGLQALVAKQLSDIDAREINTIALGKDDAGEDVVVRVGRFGPYVQKGEQTASIPEDLPPDEVSVEKALEYLAKPNSDRVLGNDAATGLPVIVKNGRFGAYVQLGEREEGGDKPRTASLFRSMNVESVTLEEALKLLSLPREIGKHPTDGEAIVAQNGRFGPYIAKGSDTRNLEAEEELFSITLEQAVALLAQPKKGRRRAAAQPGREIGVDPVSGKKVVLKAGRFGPYVTDGETNASLRTGDEPESLTIERAAELLQARRDRGPAIGTKKKAAKGKDGKGGAKKAKAAAADGASAAKASPRKRKASPRKSADA